jgi:hypothetical protein
MTPAFRKLLWAIGGFVLLASLVVECNASPQRYRAIGWGLLAQATAQAGHDHATMPRWLLEHPDFASCCSNRDCFMLTVPPRAVSGGWLVVANGRPYPPVPYQLAKVSQDGRFWACILPGASEVRCLFAPPSGA